MSKLVLGGLVAMSLVACVDDVSESDTSQSISKFGAYLPNSIPMPNGAGLATTVSTAGKIDLENEFFQDLGTNGRRCVTCHLPTAGWGTTPSQIQDVFRATRGGEIDDMLGLGAIFRTNDGANSPEADVSTLEARRAAYSMLLTKGLIRVSMAVPANAEFEIVDFDDPYHHSTAADVSMFRRPLPSANLKFLSAVMWDGRETFSGESIHFDLSDQANGATQGHAQGAAITDAQRESIVALEVGLHAAQVYDKRAGSLDKGGAHGGAAALVTQDFHIGINDNFGDCIDADGTGCRVVGAPLGSGTRGAAFSPIVFTVYDAWTSSDKSARAAIARGQKLFNTHPINISGVSGLNDEAAFGAPANVVGTCTTCHNSPNAGDHSVAAPLDIGLVDEAVRTADMPLYTLRNKTTGEIRRVTDPGRAMVTGKWKHIGRFKGPILRSLAARAPYFHNGFAANLNEVVEFYNNRFGMGLSASEKADLVAFLQTL